MDFVAKEPTCPEGLTFYDLRPYFTAFYYGSKELSDEMQAHLAACGACTKKWKFLERTDPQVSDWYSRQVDVLAEEVVALESVRYEPQTPVAAQTPSAEQPPRAQTPWTEIPSLEEIRKRIEEVWSPAADEDTRYQRAQALVEASKGPLKQASGPALEALARFMPLFQDKERTKPIGIGSVELLFLTNFVWTSLYPGIVEFLPDGTCQCNPLQFRQGRMRYEAALQAHTPAELPTGK
jgi:hypothetical protein